MAYSDGLITAPVSIYDVQRAISNSSPDLGTLCTGSTINKFARWKPFRKNSVHFASNAARLTAAKAVNYGSGIVSCGRQTFASQYQNEWSHLAPRGGGGGNAGYDEYYRLADFNLYQHNKWQLGPTAGGKGYNTIFNGYLQIPGTMVSDLDILSFNMQCRENDDLDANIGLLYPYDFSGADKDFSDYFVGLAILDHNGGVWIYSDPQISDYCSGTELYTGVRAQISSSIPNGAVIIAPVLTENRTLDSVQSGWDFSYNGDIIILDGAYLSANKVAQSANLITNITFSLAASSITLTFTVTNQTGSAVTVNNMVCYLLSDAAFINEHDNGYSGPDYQGEGAVAFISRTWPQNYKQGDIYSHDWNGGSTNPDQLAARFYNAYSDFYVANGNSNVIGNNVTRTWTKTFNYTQDEFGSYANGAWSMLCLAPQGNSFVREYSSN